MKITTAKMMRICCSTELLSHKKCNWIQGAMGLGFDHGQGASEKGRCSPVVSEFAGAQQLHGVFSLRPPQLRGFRNYLQITYCLFS